MEQLQFACKGGHVGTHAAACSDNVVALVVDKRPNRYYLLNCILHKAIKLIFGMEFTVW